MHDTTTSELTVFNKNSIRETVFDDKKASNPKLILPEGHAVYRAELDLYPSGSMAFYQFH